MAAANKGTKTIIVEETNPSAEKQTIAEFRPRIECAGRKLGLKAIAGIPAP